MPRNAARRPRRARRARNRKLRVSKRMSFPRSDIAVVKQTLQLEDDVMNTVLRYNTCNLAAFDRAVQVARAYQYYRIRLVEYKLKPYSDTYAPSGDPTLGKATPSVPYLYWLINKGDNMDQASFNSLRDAGAKPIRFDEKTITLRWKPSVLMFSDNNRGDVTGVPAFNLQKVSPWLSTNDLAGTNSTIWQPSKMPHTGILYGVEQDELGPIPYAYGAEVTVHFEFKKPLSFGGVDAHATTVLTKETAPKKAPAPVEG